jgi:hypothetical protein
MKVCQRVERELEGDLRDSEKRRNEEKKGLFFLKMTKLSEKDDDEESNLASPSSSRPPHSKSTRQFYRETLSIFKGHLRYFAI